MPADEWDATPWGIQRAYLEGLEQEGIFEMKGGGNAEDLFGPEGITRREVDTGGQVIDITGMISDLERRRGEGVNDGV